VLVLERERKVGLGTSSRNSEVLHAGLYYPPGTLKAKLCVEGRRKLYEYCRLRNVYAELLGKLVVATSARELQTLHDIASVARRNGVTDIQLIDGSMATRLEPELRCEAALLSPSTGIVDSGSLMEALATDCVDRGVTLAFNTEFQSAEKKGEEFVISTQDPNHGGVEQDSAFEVIARNLVNCAGHGAHDVARSITGLSPTFIPPRFLAKGSYCFLQGLSPFNRLIYPVPVPGALGVHVTLDMSKQLKLGPDIEWVESPELEVAPEIVEKFRNSCRSYWPGVESRTLLPGYAGLRPKIHGPSASFHDFVISHQGDHSVAGLVNLFGIESPGLTSCLAIADEVARHL
jgi:L-2-hydroxyglutarate oxidase LhgO